MRSTPAHCLAELLLAFHLEPGKLRLTRGRIILALHGHNVGILNHGNHLSLAHGLSVGHQNTLDHTTHQGCDLSHGLWAERQLAVDRYGCVHGLARHLPQTDVGHLHLLQGDADVVHIHMFFFLMGVGLCMSVGKSGEAQDSCGRNDNND